MSNEIEVNGKKIGDGHNVFVIAEIGINHNGDFDTAKQLVDEAKNAGASAAKFQTYITEKRVPKDSPIFDILKKCELSFDEQSKLFSYAREIGVEIFSTPFDDESVEFLNSIECSCYKIASFDIVNTSLLKRVAEQKKPVIMSRGMASQDEIDSAVAIVQEFNIPFALLHCVSAYPVTDHKDLNFKTIRALNERYNCPVGFSDHTLGIEVAKYAVAAGATLYEKHFTLSRDSEGPDHGLSIEPKEMKHMIEEMNKVTEILGENVWSSLPAEAEILQYRRVS